MMPTPWSSALPRLGLVLAFVFIGLWWFQIWHSASHPVPPSKKAKRPPLPLKPRTPADCSDCVHSSSPTNASAVTTAMRSWREGKSLRGRPKQIETDGYACDFKDCKYCGITDARIHALVGYGHHGKDHSIQDLYCEACQHKFSARRHTVLYRLKTQSKRVEVLAALAEGMAVAAAVRVFGHAEGTMTTWLTRAGMHGDRLHAKTMQKLHLTHVQLDELCTTLRNKGHEVWLWLALDARTKLIAAAKLGPRTQATAHALIHGLVQVLAPGVYSYLHQ